MNDSQNVITIEPAMNGRTGGSIFRAPADNHAARQLWVFLVENLQPGFVVELSNGASELTRPSGAKLPPELYAKVMGGETAVSLPDGQGRYKVWLNGRLVLTVSGWWDEIATAVVNHARQTFPGRSFDGTADCVDAGYRIVEDGETAVSPPSSGVTAAEAAASFAEAARRYRESE